VYLFQPHVSPDSENQIPYASSRRQGAGLPLFALDFLNTKHSWGWPETVLNQTFSLVFSSGDTDEIRDLLFNSWAAVKITNEPPSPLLMKQHP
jgi:hypothetical protein